MTTKHTKVPCKSCKHLNKKTCGLLKKKGDPTNCFWTSDYPDYIKKYARRKR